MPYIYGVRYGDHVVQDPTWWCVSDVIATYHGTEYVDAEHRVTGTLVRRRSESATWEEVAQREADRTPAATD